MIWLIIGAVVLAIVVVGVVLCAIIAGDEEFDDDYPSGMGAV